MNISNKFKMTNANLILKRPLLDQEELIKPQKEFSKITKDRGGKGSSNKQEAIHETNFEK